MITKVETNTGEVVLERIFDVSEARWDRENGLINIMAMQRMQSLGESYEDAGDWVIDKLESGAYRFA